MRILRGFLGFILNVVFLPNTVLAKIIGVVVTNWLATLIHFIVLPLVVFACAMVLPIWSDVVLGTTIRDIVVPAEFASLLNLYLIWGTVRAHKFFKQKRIDNQKYKCSRCQSKNIQPRLLTHGRGS